MSSSLRPLRKCSASPAAQSDDYTAACKRAGLLFRRAREAAGLTQYDAAYIARCSRSTIVRREQGDPAAVGEVAHLILLGWGDNERRAA